MSSQLTHHNSDGDVIDFSFNAKAGWAEYIDLDGLIEAVEALTGEKFRLRMNWKNPGKMRDLMRSILERQN